MTKCCQICSKIFCEKRNTIENCKDCISFVWLAMQEIDKKAKIKEEENDRIQTSKRNRPRSL